MRELDLLDKIKAKITQVMPLSGQDSSLVLSIGDDGAVFKPSPSKYLVTAQDMLVENVHFDLNYFSAYDLGHKALAVNLSDLAAMGAEPCYAQISLGLLPELDDIWVMQFYEGLLGLAKKHNCHIIGGDLVVSPRALVVDISVIGQCENFVTRKQAQIHDLVAVSGALGLSQSGLRILRQNPKAKTPATQKHLRPQPRLDLGPLLAKSGLIHTMIDLSDGLASELGHLSRQSHCGFKIDVDKIPKTDESSLDDALYGGEDYELLFTFAEENRSAIEKLIGADNVKVIGRTEKGSEVLVQKSKQAPEALNPKKIWSHF